MRRGFLFLLLAVVGLAGCSLGRRPTKVSLVDQKNPPTFKLSGTSYSVTLMVTGPFTSQNELEHDTGAIVSVWEINTGSTPNSHDVLDKLPPVTYGDTPAQFWQFRPDGKKAPPPLEAGKFYKVEVWATHGDPDGHGGRKQEKSQVCFSVTAQGVTEIECGPFLRSAVSFDETSGHHS